MINKSIDNGDISEPAGWNSAIFATRLKEVIGENSIYRFAKKCGFAESMLRKYLLGESVPGADKLVSMAQVAGVSLLWLATGQGGKSEAVGWDRITPSQLAVVLEFERYAQRRADSGTRAAVKAFVEDYNQGLLEIGWIGEIRRINEDQLILWRDLAWERRVDKASIDEEILRTAIEIADELIQTSGKVMNPPKKAKLITAIYRLNATTEGGLDRSMMVNLLMSLS